MAQHRSIRDIDWGLLIVALAICGMGVLQIYSAAHDTPWRDAWWKQIIWIVIGVILLWIVTLIDYHTMLSQVPLLYGLAITTLVATFAVGNTVFGSRRWVGAGGVHFQ